MAQPKLTRSPALTYAWMAISLVIVIVLFRRWDAIATSSQLREWWIILGGFLLADYLFLITPIRDSRAIRRLARAGKLWALVAWLSVAGFVYVAMRGARPHGTLRQYVEIISVGFLLLILLVFAIYRLSKQWVREPLRSIVARAGGGFLIHFQADAEISAALKAIAGAQPETAPAGGEDWALPANAESATALLQLAKRFDFEFVPQRSAVSDSTLQKELARAR
jgi:hypothetical protein